MEDRDAARRKVDAIIKNTYCTLMTRGMKGCFVYCADAKTASYLRSRIAYRNPPAPAAELRLVAEKVEECRDRK